MDDLSEHHKRILKQLDDMPDSSIVPVPIAAVHEGVSTKTIQRNYPLTKIGQRLNGVRLGYLRHRNKTPTSDSVTLRNGD